MPVTVTQATANRQIARAAGTVMLAFVLSNLTGLVRQILVSNAFGTQGELDAFNAASTYPDMIFNLVAGGALASAFVPTLSEFVSKNKRREAWVLSSAIINLVLLLLVVLSALSALLSPQIVQYILAPNLDPAGQVLTASLLRIRLIAPAIFGVSGLMMGILNTHQIFIWPALAPTFYWLGMIFGVLFFVPLMGIHGLAWGAVLGAVLHLVIQLPGFLKLPDLRYIPTLGLRFPAVREVGRLMGPRLLGVAVVQINFLVNAIIATGQPEGSLAAIGFAWAVMTMPQVVIAQSIAIAALPTFSAQAARGELQEMRASLAVTLRGVILLALPATLGLILLREPAIRLLFERGAFDERSTQMVSWALLWYTAGLVGHSVVEIVARAFYALHDTKTPVFIGAAAMSLNIAFSFLFSALFIQLGWMPHGGLALANSLATALEMIGLLVFMRRRLNGLQGGFILKGTIQAALATTVMSLAVWLWLNRMSAQPAWLLAGGGLVVGGLVYLFGVWLLGIEEVKGVVNEVRLRLKLS